MNPVNERRLLAEIALVRRRSWGWHLGGRVGAAQDDAVGRGFLAPHPADGRRLIATAAGLAALRRAEAAAAAA